jgi:hypothetical protein
MVIVGLWDAAFRNHILSVKIAFGALLPDYFFSDFKPRR